MSARENSPLGLFVMGSCRVHRPVASLTAGEVSYLTGGMGGYTHTVKEAIQRLAFLQGGATWPDNLTKFILGSERVPAWVQQMVDDLQMADALVVEVSSGKEVRLEDTYLQLNYLSSLLVNQLGGAGKSWWSELLRFGKPSDEVIGAALEAASAAGFGANAMAVIEGAEASRATRESLRDDIRNLAVMADRPIVLVTHVDIGKIEAGELKGRSQFVSLVEQAAEGIPGVLVFDPTVIVAAFGRRFALAEYGSDVNHYAEMFEPILGRLLVATADAYCPAWTKEAAEGAVT